MKSKLRAPPGGSRAGVIALERSAADWLGLYKTPNIAGAARRAKPRSAEQVNLTGLVLTKAFDKATEAAGARPKLK